MPRATKNSRIASDAKSALVSANCYVRRFYDPDDPMWVIGCIDAYGAITARHAAGHQDVMHGKNESRGKRWRWNIWGQEFHATRGMRLDDLNDEELAEVTDWLERKGYKKVEAHNADYTTKK